jgi:hypothetical protein
MYYQKLSDEWYFINDHDASFGHYHLCPICGKTSPTTSRICPHHPLYYAYRGTKPSDYHNEVERGK